MEVGAAEGDSPVADLAVGVAARSSPARVAPVPPAKYSPNQLDGGRR